MENPLVSIIIPTYNRAHLIIETLESIKNQTYTNWECIIVDDGSTDNTHEVVNKYIKLDNRFHFYKRPDTYKPGGNGARNFGFSLAKGDYINWFDSDDLMHKDFLAIHINNFNLDPFLNLSVCIAYIFINSPANIINCLKPKQIIGDATKLLIRGEIFFSTPCCLWSKNFLINKKLFDENLFRSQEAEFNFRRSLENLKFKYIEKYLVLVRRGHESIESQSNKDFKKIFSTYKYFDGMTIWLLNQELNEENSKLLKYTLFRQSVYFNVIKNHKNKNPNIIKFIKNGLINNINKSGFNFIFKIRAILIVLMIFYTGRGYNILKKTYDIN